MSTKMEASIAYANLINCLKSNDLKALTYVPIINQLEELDDIFRTQVLQGLMVLALESRRSSYSLYAMIIDELEIITEKETYKMVAKTFSLDNSTPEEIAEHLRTAINFKFHFPTTSYLIDVLNMLLSYAIYLRDDKSLEEVLNLMKVSE